MELRNTLKNLAHAHPGEFQVLCDIDCHSHDETPIQLRVKSESHGIIKVLQLHYRWVSLVNVVGCTGTTYFVIQKNSPTLPQVVQKNSASCTIGALERQCPSLYSSIGGRKYHCVAADVAASNTMTEAAIVRDPSPGDNDVPPDEAALVHLKCSAHRCHNSVINTL